MRRVVLFIGMLLLASVSPLVAADVVTYHGDNEQDSIVISDDMFARLVEFNKEQRQEVERRKAIIDSLEALAQVPPERVLSLACVGDMMLGVNYPSPRLTKNDGRNLFDDVREYLVGADLALGNLEGVLLDKGGMPRYGPDSKDAHMFRMPQRYAQRFVDAGFDFLSMANNHSLDFGAQAIRSTMQTLKSAGIAYAGVQNMCDYAIVERDGIRYGICAFAPNKLMCNLHDLALGERLVKKLRNELKCDIVIVSIHGGAEGATAYRVTRKTETFIGYSRGNVYAFAHRCIDAGADLVYGHGPHVVRGMELYKGKLIAYSLGNFCTPIGMKLNGRCGYAPVLIVELTTEGEFRGGRIIPAIQPYGAGPKIDTTGTVIRELQNLSRSDFPESKLVISNNGELSVKQ